MQDYRKQKGHRLREQNLDADLDLDQTIYLNRTGHLPCLLSLLALHVDRCL